MRRGRTTSMNTNTNKILLAKILRKYPPIRGVMGVHDPYNNFASTCTRQLPFTYLS